MTDLLIKGCVLFYISKKIIITNVVFYAQFTSVFTYLYIKKLVIICYILV